MWTPESSESGETRHLNAKQENEITFRQMKDAALRQREKNHAATADDSEQESLLKDVDAGQEVMCLKQQLLPKSTKRPNDDETHENMTLKDAPQYTENTEFLDSTLQDKTVAVVRQPTAINSGSTDNHDDPKVPLKQPTPEQLKCYKMTQYGNTGSQIHSKLDIQKIPQDIQQRQQQQQQQKEEKMEMAKEAEAETGVGARVGAAAGAGAGQQQPIIPTQLTSLYETTTNNRTTTTTTTATATPNTTTAITTKSIGAAIAEGVGAAVKAVNTGNINNESNGSGLPAAHGMTPYEGPKCWRYIVFHWAGTSQKIALFVIFLLLWALAYCILPNYASPGTGIMRLVFLFVGAEITGIVATHVRLPDMLGMLFFGVFYTNVGLADFSGYQKLEAVLRELALINIMLLAGLGLNASAFKKFWFMILQLTVLPTLAEVAIIMVLARYLLLMPWLWGILLGLVITAVSPNVVVTIMLKLKEDRLGLNNGIHTIIYATTTCNDVLAIFAFGVVLGVTFSTGSLNDQILQGPVGIGIGVVFGYIYGMLLQHLPSSKSSYMNGLRFVLTILGGCIAVLGSKSIGYPSAGALGCASLAFIASIGWKRQDRQLALQQQQEEGLQQNQNANENGNVPKRLDLLWKFLKPVSFALIGKEIDFSTLDGKVVGYGLLLIALGSLFRLVFAYISTYGGGLSRRERAYITISGFPKATVQAALGPIALDLARSLKSADTEQISFAENVLVISVLAIIFTAPLGAILMLRLAPVWLQKSNADESGAGEQPVGVSITTNDNRMSSTYGGVLTNKMSKFPSESNLSIGSDQSQCSTQIANPLGSYVNNEEMIDLSEGELQNRVEKKTLKTK